MLFILFVSLLILTCILLYLNDGDPLAPSSLSSEMFTLSTLVALLNQKKWGVEYSAYTIIVILTGLIAFSIGAFFVKNIIGKKKIVHQFKQENIYALNKKLIYIKPNVVILILFFMIIITFFHVKKTYEISLIMGNTGGFMTMLQYARIAYIYTDISVGNILAILGFMVGGLGYIFVFILIYNFIYFGKKSLKMIYFLPVIVYIILATMGTGRTVFIRFMVAILTIAVLLWFEKKNIKKLKMSYVIRILMIAIFAVIAFFIAFQLLGTLTGKTGEASTLDMLSIYSGSSIPALNIFLDNNSVNGNIFGSESFHSLYSTLNKLGLNFPDDTIHLSFVDFINGYRTNIYTALRTYIFDFGYTGMILIQFIMGVLFSLYYTNIKNGGLNYIFIIIYGYLNYGLAIQAIEDELLRSFMSVTQIFELLFIVVFYRILIKKN
ncbi:O-antigen polymerase [Paenibacillus sp. FSL R7-0312]|uniref:O-antigen polymerase n=1 Tax=Paenibacillus sp. FSL R7-0312 TaxID=2921682 RepID=UPI0030F5AEA0